MKLNNNIINTVVYNQQTPQQQIADNADNIKQQRQQIFFSSINLTNETNSNISDEVFYNKIISASFIEIKNNLISQVEELIELDKFYCNTEHNKELNTFLARVKIQIRSFYLINLLYNLYKFNNILKQLKHQFEDEQQSTLINSKQAISLRLDKCIGDLDKYWQEISNRLAYECEVLISIKHGLLGKINLIKKDIFKEFANRYINEKKST